MKNKYDGDWPNPFFRPPLGSLRRAFLITMREGFTVKFQTKGWKFCFMRSIKQKFQPKVWDFIVKPEQTRLLSFFIIFASDRQSAWNRQNFPSQYRQDNKKRKEKKIEIRVLFNLMLFKENFFRESHQISWFCKQNPGGKNLSYPCAITGEFRTAYQPMRARLLLQPYKNIE